MHEMSIAKCLVAGVRRHVPERELADVRVVRVRVGLLAGVVDAPLRFAFEALTSDTPLARAELEIEAVPLGGLCGACGPFTTEGLELGCPTCGAAPLRIVSGMELELKEIECVDLPVEAT